MVEAVKRHCSALHILYNSEVVGKAIESAIYQRKRAGKAVIPWLNGPEQG